jgi:hypothetical protein
LFPVTISGAADIFAITVDSRLGTGSPGMPHWKSLKHLVVSVPAPAMAPPMLALLIRAEAVLGYLDMKAEQMKNSCDLALLPEVAGSPWPFFYEPRTSRDWFALINLCQKLAARETLRAAAVGREYVRVKLGDSVVRIRVSRTMAPTEVHRDQRMYYVSYEGEYNPGIGVHAVTDHGFFRNRAPFAPSYLDVAQYLRDHPVGNDAGTTRAILSGNCAASKTELKTAAVAAFLAEGARNARAFPVNLMLLDLVQHGVQYTTRGGKERAFQIDRMFWRRFENSDPARNLRQTAGGHIPQSGAGGADVKAVKMRQTAPYGPGRWHRRTGFAPPVPTYPAFQEPVFAPSGFASAKGALTAMAGRALDKECGAVCWWLANKFGLGAYENSRDLPGGVLYIGVSNLETASLTAAPPAAGASAARLLRHLATIKAALEDRVLSLEDLLAVRIPLT